MNIVVESESNSVYSVSVTSTKQTEKNVAVDKCRDSDSVSNGWCGRY